MKLNVKERLAIIQMLPENGSISEMIDIMEIVKKVRLDQEEKNKIQYKEAGNAISWNISLDEGKEVIFKHEELSILKAAVKKLDENKGVNLGNLDICIKINDL